MSAIKVDIQNIDLTDNNIANDLKDNKRYEDYGNDVVEKITYEVVEKFKKALVSKKASRSVVFDDEELFDEIYDYMLKKLNEVFSSADIAYLVNDICMQVEDVLFDKGLVEYSN